MEDENNLYDIISDTHNSDTGYDPEISQYLRDLLHKDYNSISSEAKSLLKDAQELRKRLHRQVLDCTSTALGNINCCKDTSDLVYNISKAVIDLSDATARCNSAIEDCVGSLSGISKDLQHVNEDSRNNQLASSLLSACDSIKLESTDENLPQLLDYIELFRYLSHFGDGKLASIYSSKIENILKLKEENLFQSLNSDPNETAKIVAEIKRIGFSDTERIIVGFLENRSRYINECLKASNDFARDNPESGLNEVILTLKKRLLSIVLCYRAVFGGVDDYLSTFVNKSVQDALSTVRTILRECEMGNLRGELTLELGKELDSISDSLGSFGLSFNSLVTY